MHNVLIAGCGNIGALYDWDNESVLTHAKAFHRTGKCRLSFFDIDTDQSARVAARYNGEVIDDIHRAIGTGNFDIVSICTPTVTHYELLDAALSQAIPVIICEKPVSVNSEELDSLEEKYAISQSKVLVNYIRRFQPAFIQLKSVIAGLPASEKLTNISIRYQRGFTNNCSHAFDLLQFLFAKPFVPEHFVINRKDFDHFQNDPTVTGYAEWIGASLSVIGLQNVSFSFFEIDIFFSQYRVQIRNAGNTIEIFIADDPGRTLSPLVLMENMRITGGIQDYMIPVADQAIALLTDTPGKDNFMEALQLNKTILTILNN